MFDKLTKRQKEVLDYVMCGFSNEEIARLLFLSQGRVSALVNNLYDKYCIDTKPFRVKLILKRFEELGFDYKKMKVWQNDNKPKRAWK